MATMRSTMRLLVAASMPLLLLWLCSTLSLAVATTVAAANLATATATEVKDSISEKAKAPKKNTRLVRHRRKTPLGTIDLAVMDHKEEDEDGVADTTTSTTASAASLF